MGDFQGNFDKRRSRGRSDRGRGRFDRDSPREFGGRGQGRDSGRSRGFGGRDKRSERYEMHPAICDKCGKDCEVPFKPTEGKPIYCDNCFKSKSKEAGSRSEFGKPINNEKFDQINDKLDKILRILESKPVEKKEKPKSTSKVKIEKEEPKLEYAEDIKEKKPKKKKAKKKKS